MEDLKAFGALAIVLTAVVAVGHALWSYHYGSGRVERERQQKLAAQRAQRARARGWDYDATADGDIRYRLHGTSPGGRPWTIEYDSDHSSSTSRPKLVFRADHRGRGGIEWRINDRRAFETMRGGVGRLMSGVVATVLAGRSQALAEHREFLERAREIPAGSTRLRARFVLCGIDPSAGSLVDAEVERLMLAWPAFKPSYTRPDNCFSAALRSGGLEVTIACDGPDFEVIEHLAKLGGLLADRISRRH